MESVGGIIHICGEMESVGGIINIMRRNGKCGRYD